MKSFGVYEDIATRTGGDIYIGVVGPVRTGKSTFIKKFMQELVLPQVTGAKKKRYTDELPQAASGRTVMTTEPKFVPEEAAELKVKDAVARVRLIDCVGYPVEGATGFEENGVPRFVKTPWSEEEVSFNQAAEDGTRRVIRDHSTIGILVTTDGSITDLPRSAYEAAEKRAQSELHALGKPYVILLNCRVPADAEELRAELEEKYNAPVLALNVEEANAEKLASVLERVLYEFPVACVDIDLPDWMRVLDADSPILSEVLGGVRAVAPKLVKMSDCALLDTLYSDSDRLLAPSDINLDAATGCVRCRVNAKEGVFYSVLGEQCGEEIADALSLSCVIVRSSLLRRSSMTAWKRRFPMPGNSATGSSRMRMKRCILPNPRSRSAAAESTSVSAPMLPVIMSSVWTCAEKSGLPSAPRSRARHSSNISLKHSRRIPHALGVPICSGVRSRRCWAKSFRVRRVRWERRLSTRCAARLLRL